MTMKGEPQAMISAGDICYTVPPTCGICMGK